MESRRETWERPFLALSEGTRPSPTHLGLLTSRDDKVQFFKPLSFWGFFCHCCYSSPCKWIQGLRETAPNMDRDVFFANS